jgi:glycogen debranching enzyme
MCSGWGLRTLAGDAAGYNPLSYHCGSVWPHDTALTVAGLSRYGFNVEADRLASDLIDAATAVGGSLPELFGGFARDDIGEPVPYPSSCSPQAWASAAPMLLMRAMLGLEPDVPNGRIRMRPRLPERIGVLTLRGLQIGPDLVDIAVSRRDCRVTGTDLRVDVT